MTKGLLQGQLLPCGKSRALFIPARPAACTPSSVPCPWTQQVWQTLASIGAQSPHIQSEDVGRAEQSRQEKVLRQQCDILERYGTVTEEISLVELVCTYSRIWYGFIF